MPCPNSLHPIPGVTRTVYLKNIITNPQIIVGDYTYYDDPVDVHNFEQNVLYLFDFLGDQLIIGKFCQIASGVRFIMNGANHAIHGASTYPFKIFGPEWAHASLEPPNKGDTVISNDVWIGNSATIMPGVRIGDGAIIASGSVVTRDVSPYTVVGGNPAHLIRERFNAEDRDFLCALRWWDWPLEKITAHVDLLSNGAIATLKERLAEHA